MKVRLIVALLILSSSAYAGNDITILRTNSIVMSTGAVRPEHSDGEIKLMCIAGYKVVIVRLGGIDAPPVVTQLIGKDGKAVYCNE
jgi:hypothetical protein